MPTKQTIQATLRRYGRVCGIYAITGPGKRIYVGASQDVWLRRNVHIAALREQRHSSLTLQYDWDRFGPWFFKFTILEECAPEQLREREMAWCKKLHAVIRGYNSRYPYGGRGEYRNRHSDETIRRMRASQQARWNERKKSA